MTRARNENLETLQLKLPEYNIAQQQSFLKEIFKF